MRIGRGNWNWTDIIIIGLAAVMVYPDKVLASLGERTGRVFGWRHVMLLEILAIGSTVALMIFLLPDDSNLRWWRPLMAVGALATVRGVQWVVGQLLGLND